MTLKEAYDTAKDTDRIKRMGDTFPMKKRNLDDHCHIEIEDAIADDWEIVGKKKKVVIEGVTWSVADHSKILFPCDDTGNQDFLKFLFQSVMKRTEMKMTLEWEE